MRKLSSIPRPLLFTAATIFAVALVAYTGIWLYYAGWQPPTRIGVEGKRPAHTLLRDKKRHS